MSESSRNQRTYFKNFKFDVSKNNKHPVMKYLFFILLFISVNTFAICEITDSETGTQPKIVPALDNKNINNSSIDYKILYENQKDFSSDILSTVYWALGSILLIILVIIGSNLFFNFKFNKKQYVELENELTKSIELLKSNLVQKITEEMTEFSKVSDEKIEKYKSDSKKEHDERIKELTNNYQERLVSFSDNLKEQILSLKERLENTQKENSTTIGNLKNSISVGNKDINELIERKSNEVKMDIEGLQAELWKNKKLYRSALSKYISQSIYAIEINWTWKLKYTLGDVIEMLGKIGYLHKYDVERLEKLFPKIPDEYAIEIAKIKTFVDKLPVNS